MQNYITQFNAPSPVNTTTFQMNIPQQGISVEVVGNQVIFCCFGQGSAPVNVTRNFLYHSVPYSWDDEGPPPSYNFVCFVVVQQGVYALLEQWR